MEVNTRLVGTSQCRVGKSRFQNPVVSGGLTAVIAVVLAGPHIATAQSNTMNVRSGAAASVTLLRGPVGNCISDDSDALQALLDKQMWFTLPEPVGGCYLISKTLIMRAGSYIFGQSANNPGLPPSGVVIRLAPGRNVPLIKTFTADGPPGSGNEYMAIENVVLDGNGAAQTQELNGEALVDWRGTFIQTFLRHVTIMNSFGPALFTGSTQLDNVWIIASSSSSYAWIHNPGNSGYGAIMANQVYVEETMTPSGGHFRSPWDGSVNDPSSFAHAVHFNGMNSGTLNQLHCESAATCLDINDIQSLTIHGMTGNRIGNPASPDPTDQYLVRALNKNILSFTLTAAYFDQSGSTYKGAYYNSRVFGLCQGVQSNDIYETPVGRTTMPLYTYGETDQAQTGFPFLGERSVVANDLFVQKVGNYSPNHVALFDNDAPNGEYAYVEHNGNTMTFGFSPGPLDANEEHMLRLNWFGPNNPGNAVQIDEGRLQTGTEANSDIAGELTVGGASSATYVFKHTYQIHPECTVTPQFDTGLGNRFWISYPGADSFAVNFSTPVTGPVSYVCIGRQ